MAKSERRLYLESNRLQSNPEPGLSFFSEKKRDNVAMFLRGLEGEPFDGTRRVPRLYNADYLHDVYSQEVISYLLGRRIGQALKYSEQNGNARKIAIGVVGIEGMNTAPWGDSPDDRRRLGEIGNIIRGPYSEQVSRVFSKLYSAFKLGQLEERVKKRDLTKDLINLVKTVEEIVSTRAKLSAEGGRGIKHFTEGEEKVSGRRSKVPGSVFAGVALTSILASCAPLPPAIIQELPTPSLSGEVDKAQEDAIATVVPQTVTVVVPETIQSEPLQAQTSEPTKTPEPTSTFTPEPTPTPINWDAITPEERFNLAPLNYTAENGLVLEKSNVSSLKPDLIFYRDSEGWVRAAYDGKSFYEMPRDIEKVGVLEIQLLDRDGDGKSDGKYEGFAFVLNIPEDVDKEQARELKKQALVAFFEIMLKKGATLRFRDAIAYDSFSNAIYNLGSTHLLPVSEIAGATREKNGGTSVSVFNRDGKLIGDLILKWWGVYLGDVDAYPERFVVIKIPNDNPWRREKKPSRLVDSDFFAGIIVGPIGGDEFETLLDEIVFSGGIIEK